MHYSDFTTGNTLTFFHFLFVYKNRHFQYFTFYLLLTYKNVLFFINAFIYFSSIMNA